MYSWLSAAVCVVLFLLLVYYAPTSEIAAQWNVAMLPEWEGR
jgi:hypothetical protein